MTDLYEGAEAIKAAAAEPRQEPAAAAEPAPAAEPAAAKKKPGRPRGSASKKKRTRTRKAPDPDAAAARERAARQAAAEADAARAAARDARLAILTLAFQVTGETFLNRAAQMQPEWKEPQARVLAEAWLPVLDMYAPQTGPLGQAIMATAIVLGPYGAQLVDRQRRKAKENGRQVGVVGDE